jgi:hypothetical protein
MLMPWIAMLLTLLPLLLACGTLLVMAWRGKPAWSTPYCRACGYDLRGRDPERTAACPECGADLTDKRALQYVRGKGRRWGLAAWALALLALPFVIAGGVWLYAVSTRTVGPGSYGSVPTSALIATHLPPRIDEPWVWNELENRLKAGTLTPAQADAALRELTAHLAGRPIGRDGHHLSWQEQFLNDAHAAGLFTEPALLAFGDAYFGPQARIEPLPRLREGRSHVSVDVWYGSNWGQDLPVALDWELVEIRLNGSPVEGASHDSYSRNNKRWRESLDLDTGEHVVTIVIDAAYLDRRNLSGLTPERVPVANWPKPIKRWRQEIDVPLRVYADDVELVAPVSDPALDPTGGVQICQLAIQPDGKRAYPVSEVYFTDPTLPVSFDVRLRAGDHDIDAGYVGVVPQPGGGRRTVSSQSRDDVTGLDPSIRRVDVHLIPNAEHIEDRPEVERFWGEPIVIEGVELRRLDLPAE